MKSYPVSLGYSHRQLPASQKFMWAFTHSKIPQKECKGCELGALVPVITTKQEGGDGVRIEQKKGAE